MLAFDATYFGDAADPSLFGLLQRTNEARANAESVLICYPAPQATSRGPCKSGNPNPPL